MKDKDKVIWALLLLEMACVVALICGFLIVLAYDLRMGR